MASLINGVMEDIHEWTLEDFALRVSVCSKYIFILDADTIFFVFVDVIAPVSDSIECYSINHHFSS